MEFILGCNYWASNAGAEMWRKFDAEVIKDDLRLLSEHGVKYMRVFPNWRDFQPIMPLYSGSVTINSYCLEGERLPENPYYLDTGAMAHFKTFLDLCDEAGIKLIVGLITGWMSGRMFIPSAMYGKNVITDPLAIYFEQLFIKGFVSQFKSRDTIYAWDLGNECNCMGKATRYEAASWTATIANAIRAEDPTRPVVSGMHGIDVDPQKTWLIRDQAFFTDLLTTHPYPYWCRHTRNDETLALRTTMHATAENKYYSECGGKPCMAEEIGTMGPMLSSNEAAAKFLRTNFFSLWANGSVGCMWWCAHEQTELTTFPYTTNMVERELGMMTIDKKPKPVLLEMKKFSEFLKSANITLPPARTDAVCLLSNAQRHWGVCLTSHVLARRAGFNLRYAYADDGIPEADIYLLPSINSITIMNLPKFVELCEKVKNGATLYISMNNGVIAEFDKLTGMRVLDSYESPDRCELTVNGKNVGVNTERTYLLESVGADVLLYDKRNNPCLSTFNFGKGKVIYLNMPLEEGLIDGHNTLEGDEYELYKFIFRDIIEQGPVTVTADGAYTTYHDGGDKLYTVTVNHSARDAEITIKADGYKLNKVYYGSENKVRAFDAAVLEFVKV